jgi:folate-binding protein YgfZ
MNLVAQQESPAENQRTLREQLHALASGCGAYRLDRDLISLAGKDRVRWLNGMVSNNIRDLAPGQGVYAFVLNPQGNIQGDLYAFNRGETLILEIESAQGNLLPQLRRYIIMDKVEVTELGDSVSVLGIAGPKSNELLAALGITAADSPVLAVSDTSWNDAAITLIRGDNPCVPNYEFWVPKDDADSFWRSLIQSGSQEIDTHALEAFRILCGIPKIGADIRERTLPQETGQDRALNFNKGCYIGQEIVERIRARGAVHRVLTGFEIDGSVQPGTAIQAGGKDVGHVTSLVRVPMNSGEKVIALGYLRREHLSPEAVFDVAGAKVRPVSLPFTGVLEQL